MDDHYLADHVVDPVLQLADGRELTVRVGAAEAPIKKLQS
jgi:hypothetical protein